MLLQLKRIFGKSKIEAQFVTKNGQTNRVTSGKQDGVIPKSQNSGLAGVLDRRMRWGCTSSPVKFVHFIGCISAKTPFQRAVFQSSVPITVGRCGRSRTTRAIVLQSEEKNLRSTPI
jgi:hypothetical protein